MSKLKKVKQEAWEFYNSWRKVKSYSPALQSEVRISLLGWRHISGATGAKKRTYSDTHRRFKLLPYAKQIIETSTTIQNVSTKGKKTFYVIEAMIEIKENTHRDFRKVRVILVEDKQKNKVFYSVMDKKQKKEKAQKSGTPHA
ncbi:hypothetical protein HYW46_06940 [Candidatus Daviesbacteria bacterium]|nr:hypothetical protein [Candidatus Daviesbacteria bacterium]